MGRGNSSYKDTGATAYLELEAVRKAIWLEGRAYWKEVRDSSEQ